MSEQPVDDGLVIPDVGAWSRRKYHFLGRYLDAFTTSMKDKWAELHYVDLFAGAGIARFKSNRELAYSSALLASRVKFPFTQLHLCEADPVKADALRNRLRACALPNPPRVITGDANLVIEDLLNPIPASNALCMTFADPYGLHLDFETVRVIARRKSDLVILVADNMDALRNWATYYDQNPNSNLDRFMGEGGWRDLLRVTSPSKQAEAFRQRYQDRLRTLGYDRFDTIRVQNSMDRDIYSLQYASRSEVGLKIWQNTSKKDEFGQMGLGFS